MAKDLAYRHLLAWLRCSVVCILCLAGCNNPTNNPTEVDLCDNNPTEVDL